MLVYVSWNLIAFFALVAYEVGALDWKSRGCWLDTNRGHLSVTKVEKLLSVWTSLFNNKSENKKLKSNCRISLGRTLRRWVRGLNHLPAKEATLLWGPLVRIQLAALKTYVLQIYKNESKYFYYCKFTGWFLRGLSEVIKRNLKNMSCILSDA